MSDHDRPTAYENVQRECPDLSVLGDDPSVGRETEITQKRPRRIRRVPATAGVVLVLIGFILLGVLPVVGWLIGLGLIVMGVGAVAASLHRVPGASERLETPADQRERRARTAAA